VGREGIQYLHAIHLLGNDLNIYTASQRDRMNACRKSLQVFGREWGTAKERRKGATWPQFSC